ncbi:MAG: spermidine/putrescine transport system permease protein [Rhodospirillaceae bacterium]|jgi:ABC-type spermidine/putrescine transport system permease subunit I|nr:spermidine/putrescine transport system permease protein [Rhodospirillaceae bacterium]
MGLAVVLLPPLVTLVCLFLIPICLMAVYSLWAMDDNYQIQTVLQLTQYRKIFSEPLYLQVLGISAYMALLTTIGCLMLALPLAYFIARFVPAKWRVLLVVALIIPGWVSVLIRTYAWTLVIGESGLLNWFLISLGLIKEPVGLLFTKTAVVIGLMYIYLPYMMVPIYAAIERLEQPLLEAAENLGAGPIRRFTRITLPLISPGIIAGCVITFIPALGEYLVPNLLGGLQGTMYGNLITTSFLSFNWPLGAALSVVLLAGVLACLLAVARFADLNRSLFAG